MGPIDPELFLSVVFFVPLFVRHHFLSVFSLEFTRALLRCFLTGILLFH